MIAENSSSAAPTASAAVCTDLQQLQKIELTTVAGKELTDNDESANGVGNGKRSPPHEEIDLQEWYGLFNSDYKKGD